MSVEALMAVSALSSAAPSLPVAPSMTPTAATAATSGPSFESLVTRGVETVNNQLIAGERAVHEAALGQGASLHQVMVQLEESRLSLQLLMQVRGRLLESYQEVMRMQI